MLTNTSVATPTTSPRIKTGEYPGKVTNIIVIPFGDRPVIFTTINVGMDQHVTHAVRLHNLDAARIGLNELRSGFPNKLGALDDKSLIRALKNLVIKGDDVVALVVPQLDKGIPVRLKNGEIAYNIRLRSTQPMSDAVLDSALDRVMENATKAAAEAKAKADSTGIDPFSAE